MAMNGRAAIASGYVLSVALCGAVEAGEVAIAKTPAVMHYAPVSTVGQLVDLPPITKISDDALLTATEINAIAKRDKFTVLPASYTVPDGPVRPVPTDRPVENFVNKLDYNLQRIDVSAYGDYSFDVFWHQARSVQWDILALYGGVTLFGINNWDWGTSGYHIENEGWFGTDTKYGGMDKLGHAYTGYVISQYFSQRIAHTVDDPTNAAITGAILGMGFQTYIEFFDGFAGQHGFSYEDMIANGIGASFSFLRDTVPGLRDKLDFRLEYWGASEYHDWSPATDYDGQRYLLALKLSGFEELEDSPLRYVELQAGYFTEGYTDQTRDAGVDPERKPYVAIGLNLNELLGMAPEVANTLPGHAASTLFEYWQPPYTYVATAYHD
jgi:hypothetical protein